MNKSEAYFSNANEILRETYRDLLDVTNFRMQDLSEPQTDHWGYPAATVLAHRFGKQLWNADTVEHHRLRKESAVRVLAEEERLSRFNEYRLKYCIQSRTRSALYKARQNIAAWLTEVKVSDVSLPPGETYVSARGRVSIFQKLKREWTVTPEACDSFITLIMNTKWLRKLAIRRLRVSDPFWDKIPLVVRDLMKGGEDWKGWLDNTIRESIRTNLLTIVPGSRLSAVPKDTEKMRPINVEPLGNVMLQLGYGASIKKQLRDRAGNDLYEGQSDHREMAQDLSYATIDFSGASDTIHCDLVTLLFPKSISKKLMTVRSPMVDVGYLAHDNALLSLKEYRTLNPNKLGPEALAEEIENEKWMWLHKYASMGNGTTFEVLTTVLLSIARTFDSTARVYGDDVIIRKDVAGLFMEVCEDIGFKVNRDKSFTRGRFRESCGFFYHEFLGEILSFEFDQVVNIQHLVISCNKLYHLIQYYSGRDFPSWKFISSILHRARRRLIMMYPELKKFMGPPQDLNFRWDPAENRYKRAVGDTYVYTMIGDEPVTRVRLNVRDQRTAVRLLKEMHYGSNVKFFLSIEEVKVEGTKTPRLTKSIERIASYLYSGRVTPDLIRVDAKERRFRTVWLITDGVLVWKVSDLTTRANAE